MTQIPIVDTFVSIMQLSRNFMFIIALAAFIYRQAVEIKIRMNFKAYDNYTNDEKLGNKIFIANIAYVVSIMVFMCSFAPYNLNFYSDISKQIQEVNSSLNFSLFYAEFTIIMAMIAFNAILNLKGDETHIKYNLIYDNKSPALIRQGFNTGILLGIAWVAITIYFSTYSLIIDLTKLLFKMFFYLMLASFVMWILKSQLIFLRQAINGIILVALISFSAVLTMPLNKELPYSYSVMKDTLFYGNGDYLQFENCKESAEFQMDIKNLIFKNLNEDEAASKINEIKRNYCGG